MPQNAFFPRTRDLLVNQKTTQRPFFHTLHPLSPAIFATATVLVFVLLRNSTFKFHCYTQRKAKPTQKSAQKWHWDLSRLLARKITKGIHLCKPASLNRPIGTATTAAAQGMSDNQIWLLVNGPQIRYLQRASALWTINEYLHDYLHCHQSEK